MAEVKQQDTDPSAFIAKVTRSNNLVGDVNETELLKFGHDAVEMYNLDLNSMKPWLSRMDRGIKLASLVKDDKTYPHDKASNVKYPLITNAATQFNARAYPAIVAPDAVVKAKVFGQDQDGMKAAKAQRVSDHMSWQLLHEIEEWEEETDKLLVQVPIVGTMIRKVWFDPSLGRLRCRVLDAGKFIINDRVKSLNDAPRLSEILMLYPNEITQREKSGTFRQIAYPKDMDPQKPQDFIEQHCLLDLDGDGYSEPYIMTVHVETQQVVRIVSDFEADDVIFEHEEQPVEVENPQVPGEFATMTVQVPVAIKHIQRGSYFIPYHLMPSLDGGFFGTGLGLLLGDITEAINSTINMLMDAGHMSSMGSGFLGSEFRVKGGAKRFSPGEWKTVNASGAAIRESIVPLNLPGPDATLYQMLGLLIEAGRETASIKDIMTGDAGTRNMTATATMALIEQGMTVFTAAYKRIFRSLGKEFALIAKINAKTTSQEQYAAFHDIEGVNVEEDYNTQGMDFAPVADPSSITKMQRMAQAELVMQMAREGLANPQGASQMVLDAAQIPDREALMPQPDPMQEQMAQMQMQSSMADLVQKRVDIELTLARVEEAKANVIKDLSGVDLNERKFDFEAMTTMLMEQRDELATLIAGGAGGMAGPPNNPQTQGNVGGRGGGAAPFMAGASISGQPERGIPSPIGLAG